MCRDALEKKIVFGVYQEKIFKIDDCHCRSSRICEGAYFVEILISALNIVVEVLLQDSLLIRFRQTSKQNETSNLVHSHINTTYIAHFLEINTHAYKTYE
jgi:hypothetical protein